MLLEVKDFSYSFQGRRVLDRVSFSLEEGERLAVIGPNGAGKTTLLRCLDRILTGGEGSILLTGRPARRFPRRLLARYLSYVPQADGYCLPYTVAEFVAMGRYPHRGPFAGPDREDERAVAEALELTGTAGFAGRTLGTLSGGERQKVFLAAALAQRSRALLLDEPTTFLDPRHQDEICRILRRVNRERGVALVSVTHEINNAVLLCERVLALKEGRVVFAGSVRELMTPDVLERVFDRRFLLLDNPHTGLPVVVPGGDE